MIDWGTALRPETRKAIQQFWEQYYPSSPLPDKITEHSLEVLLKRLGTRPDTKKWFPQGRDYTLSILNKLTAEEKDMAKKDHPAGGAPATVTAGAKELTAEEKAQLEAETGTAGKNGTTKEPKTPRAGQAPGGLSWVAWFRVQVKENGITEKEAEAQYVELRKDEPAYQGEEGGKKLKRHAYHHRVLALDPKKPEGEGEPAAE